MAAPIVFPLLVIGGGIVALLASKKSAAQAPALPPPEPAPPPPAPAPIPSGPSSTGITMGPMPITASGPGSMASTPGVVTLPTTVITGTPSTSTNATPWSGALSVPTKLPAIPAGYAATSPETVSIQQALNAWAAQVGAPVAPLTEDGSYGPLTQQAAAAFQVWENATNPLANLSIDGLAGPETQNFLLDFGPLTSGAY